MEVYSLYIHKVSIYSAQPNINKPLLPIELPRVEEDHPRQY